MDDRPGVGTNVAVCVHVGHNVVAQAALVPFGILEIDVIDMFFKLIDLGPRNGQPQFGLGLGQCHPKPPPSAEFSLRPPEGDHLRRGIAGNKGVVVLCVVGIGGHGILGSARAISVDLIIG